MNVQKINLSEKFGKLPDRDYAVGLIAKMNDYDFKIRKIQRRIYLAQSSGNGRNIHHYGGQARYELS